MIDKNSGLFSHLLANSARVIVALVALSPSLGLAFSAKVHYVVCRMAQLELSKEENTVLRNILSSRFQANFADLCNWPDDVRGQAEYKWSGALHYVNVDRHARAVNLAKDCNEGKCIIGALATLQRSFPFSTAIQKAEALSFVGHLVADLHQPLHVAYKDDLGGNKTQVRFLGKKISLHKLWDEQLLAQRWAEESKEHVALRLNKLISAENHNQWRNGNFCTWANESLQITQEIYKNYKKNIPYDHTYLTKYGASLEKRVILSALRLSKLLENFLQYKEAPKNSCAPDERLRDKIKVKKRKRKETAKTPYQIPTDP